MLQLTIIQQITVWIIPVLLAITLHEAAHAWAACKLGDNTAKSLGRLSFNPCKHIDLVGTILIPILLLLTTDFNFVFGWAKPVPINAVYFKNPRRDIALATAAGPLANLIMIIFWSLILKITVSFSDINSMAGLFFALAGRAGIIINLVLLFFNLLPIPPFDGSKIAVAFLAPQLALRYEKIEPYGFFILLALMLTGILNFVLTPLINSSLKLISLLFNL